MTVKERLTTFIKTLDISKRAFERKVGLSHGYVNNIVNSIQPDKLDKITHHYPQLSPGWLMTGEGEMLKDDYNTNLRCKTVLVPLLPISAEGGTLGNFANSVNELDCERIKSPIDGADLAMPVRGDSMAPEYPNGSQIFIKRINERAFIEWGKVYVLDTCNGSIIKQIEQLEDPNKLKCISINPKYSPFEIKLEDIYGVYKVMLCMSMK